MDNDNPDTLPGMMKELRKLTRELEKLLAKNLRLFEDTTGLTVDGIELIHRSTAEISNERLTMRIATVKLDVRL